MVNRWMRSGLFATGALIAVFALTADRAQAVMNGLTLADLFGGQTIRVGDKLFDNWALLDTNVDVSLVGVSGLADEPLNPGLAFDTSSVLFLSGTEQLFLEFNYRVSVVDAPLFIKDNSLEITSHVFGSSPGGFIVIGETVTDTDSAFLASKLVLADNLNSISQLFDSAEFPLQKSINVATKIFLQGDFKDDFVKLNSFEQRFSQAPIPEPSAAFLFAGGGLLVFRALRRNRRRSG